MALLPLGVQLVNLGHVDIENGVLWLEWHPPVALLLRPEAPQLGVELAKGRALEDAGNDGGRLQEGVDVVSDTFDAGAVPVLLRDGAVVEDAGQLPARAIGDAAQVLRQVDGLALGEGVVPGQVPVQQGGTGNPPLHCLLKPEQEGAQPEYFEGVLGLELLAGQRRQLQQLRVGPLCQGVEAAVEIPPLVSQRRVEVLAHCHALHLARGQAVRLSSVRAALSQH